MARLLPVPVCLLIAAGAGAEAQAPVLEPVLQAELAFARLASQAGIRAAFLANLAEEACVFTPRMASVQEAYGAAPGDPGSLVWYPEAMGLAASEDFAWSFGPWTYAAKPGAPALVHGHFLSVWRRQGTRGWQVVADIGVPHAAPPQSIEPFVAPAGAALRPTGGAADPQGVTRSLREAESALAVAWAERGGPGLLPWLARDARVLRPGAAPARGGGAIGALLAKDPAGPRWDTARLQVATSGELAWTCGESPASAKGGAASFLRVWIQEAGAWKVLFDVRLPHL